MKIIRYQEPPSSKGELITIQEAYQFCCVKYASGWSPDLLGYSYSQFLEALIKAEKECLLQGKPDGCFIDYDNIAW